MEGRRAYWVLALVVGALLLAPGTARAASVPVIVAGPVVVGAPHVGSVLQATAIWTGDPQPTATWQWLRCGRANGGPCPEIAGASTDRYQVRSADEGFFLRARLRVDNPEGFDEERSAPTPAILPAIVPTPTPTATPTATPSPPQPTPTAQPTPTPSPQPGPVVFDSVAPAPAVTMDPVLIPTTRAAPRALRPFPVVRIKGVLTRNGALVTLLSVRAPQGVRIAVRCRGVDCPRQSFTAPSGRRRLRLFERALRAGTRLELRITKAGSIGKYTSIVIRRGAAPARTDRCLEPGKPRPVRCASS